VSKNIVPMQLSNTRLPIYESLTAFTYYERPIASCHYTFAHYGLSNGVFELPK